MKLAMLQDWLGKPEKQHRRARTAERFAAIGLACPLGDVVDLSTGGARVKWSKKPALKVGDTFSLKLASESQCVRVQAVVVWLRRAGLLGGGEIGFKFMGVSKPMAIALVQLGKYGFVTSDASTAEAIAQETGAKPRGEENAPSAGSHTGHSSNASDERHGGTSARSSSSANGKVTAEVEVDDLYRALGVGRDANEDQIKAAYRKLALELHPDRNPSKDAATRFAYVSKAYTVLRDAELRARYDVLLSSSKPAHKAA